MPSTFSHLCYINWTFYTWMFALFHYFHYGKQKYVCCFFKKNQRMWRTFLWGVCVVGLAKNSLFIHNVTEQITLLSLLEVSAVVLLPFTCGCHIFFRLFLYKFNLGQRKKNIIRIGHYVGLDVFSGQRKHANKLKNYQAMCVFQVL